MTGSTTRRRLLAGLCGSVVLAGCSDASPGVTPAPDDTEEADPTPTARPAEVTCAALDDGVEPYDAGETALLLDFDYPAVFAGAVEFRDPNVVRASRAGTDGRRPNFGVEQGLPVDGAPSDGAIADNGWVRAFSFTVDGRDGRSGNDGQQAWKRPEGTTQRIGAAERLFYLRVERGGDRLFARVQAAVRADRGRGAVDAECARALSGAADRIVRSMRLNEDSTALF